MKRRQFIKSILGLAVAAPVMGCAKTASCVKDVSPAPVVDKVPPSTIAWRCSGVKTFVANRKAICVIEDVGDIHTATYPYWKGKSVFTPEELEVAGKAALDFYLSNKPVSI